MLSGRRSLAGGKTLKTSFWLRFITKEITSNWGVTMWPISYIATKRKHQRFTFSVFPACPVFMRIIKNTLPETWYFTQKAQLKMLHSLALNRPLAILNAPLLSLTDKESSSWSLCAYQRQHQDDLDSEFGLSQGRSSHLEPGKHLNHANWNNWKQIRTKDRRQLSPT